jgi:hypothetical protein
MASAEGKSNPMRYLLALPVTLFCLVGCGGSSQPSLEGKWALDLEASGVPNLGQDMKTVPYLRFEGPSRVFFTVNGSATDEMAANYELKGKLIRVFPEEYVRPIFFGIDGTLYKEGMAIEWELRSSQIIWAQRGRPGRNMVFNRLPMPAPARPN